MVVIVTTAPNLNDRVIQGRNGIALARDLGRDALIDFRGQARINQDGQFRLPQHVDKAGSDNHAVDINRPRALRAAQIADGGDLAAANTDVTRVPW